MVFPRAVGIWVLLLVLAVANGWLRQAVLEPRMGPLPAHQVSSVALSLAILAVTTLLGPSFGSARARSLLGVGLLWVALTVAFEFVFGRMVAGESWPDLMADYDVLAGRLWPLVLVTLLAAPAIAARLRRPRRR